MTSVFVRLVPRAVQLPPVGQSGSDGHAPVDTDDLARDRR